MVVGSVLKRHGPVVRVSECQPAVCVRVYVCV